MDLKRENFHTFDALRFFSFLIVFFSHIPFEKTKFMIDGTIGVYFFFVLSGFLITYILLLEKKHSINFSFKRYITRRVLRIWPLYYSILLFAYATPFVLSILNLKSTEIGYNPNWVLSSFFLENYMVIYHNSYANVSPLPVIWSLCIEEHFYILWGLILYFNKQKFIPYWIICIIILSNFSRFIFDINGWIHKDILTNFDFFMFGAIPAFLYINYKEKLLTFIENITITKKIILIVLTVFFSVFSVYIDFIETIKPTIYGLLFSGIIFVILPDKNPIKFADTNLFSLLGKYTYGLYMIHIIVINLFLKIYDKLDISDYWFIKFIIFFFSTISVTIILSITSYYIIERPFLKLKN